MPTFNIILNDKRPNAFPLKSKEKRRLSAIHTSISVELKIMEASETRYEKHLRM